MAPFDSAADSVSIQATPVTIAFLRQRVKTDLTLGERRKRELLTGLSSYAKYLSIDPDADSDEAAQAFRDDGAWYSDMMSPRARSLAGW